ncbi:MAG: hypothetical protein HON27_13220 [Candidatus Marinimicrobia bacterium]|jgi:hypothetical protein|nr:hypothetical protein [Candidatus Neomarinimicrobiota bacterium]
MRNIITYVLFLVYLATLGLSFIATNSFIVIGLGELLLASVIVGVPCYFVFSGRSFDTTVVLLHIIIAILIHPAVIDKVIPPKYASIDQAELLRQSQDWKLSWADQADASYALSKSLNSRTVLKMARNHPLLYWLFPPSVALTIWGVLIFVLMQWLEKRESHI